MNKLIKLIIKGDDYNHAFKWNSVEEFAAELEAGTCMPKEDDIVVEAYIDDNLVDIGNTFGVTLEKLQLVLGIQFKRHKNMQKIKIDNLSKLKITKVTDWKIYFDYDGAHYMILNNDDEDGVVSLYKREIDNGKVRVIFLNRNMTLISIRYFIKDISKKHPKHLVYSNIDREYFVKKLLSMGFSSGLFEAEYQRKDRKIKQIRKIMRDLSSTMKNIDNKWEKTSGHGSKCYGQELKNRKAERVVGAKDGEWCDQYKDYYGNTHPEYGGVLTDLFNLPVGTSFYVCNGCYDAIIIADEHGDKCIVTNNSCVKLTKEYHSLYIEK